MYDAIFFAKPLEEWASHLLKWRRLWKFRLGKIKFKNMTWGPVDLDCYLNIHTDMPGWLLDT